MPVFRLNCTVFTPFLYSVFPKHAWEINRKKRKTAFPYFHFPPGQLRQVRFICEPPPSRIRFQTLVAEDTEKQKILSRIIDFGTFLTQGGALSRLAIRHQGFVEERRQEVGGWTHEREKNHLEFDYFFGD